jgi:hypothetical protein
MVSSIQVAHLLVPCVLIGSLAELLFSFCRWSVLAFLQMVVAITGKVMPSMVIVLALWDPQRTLPYDTRLNVSPEGCHIFERLSSPMARKCRGCDTQ